jgi:hypothetical protein
MVSFDGTLWSQDENLAFDEEGFVVCKDHGQRRYGYRSLPYVARREGTFVDYSLAGATPQQIERHIIFGEEIPA